MASLRQLADAEHRLEQPVEVNHSWEEEGRVLLKQLGVKQSAESVQKLSTNGGRRAPRAGQLRTRATAQVLGGSIPAMALIRK